MKSFRHPGRPEPVLVTSQAQVILCTSLATNFPIYFTSCVCSVVSDCLRHRGLWPTRLFCPWDFPSKNTGVGCHSLLQGIFLTQGLNPCLLHLLHHSMGRGGMEGSRKRPGAPSPMDGWAPGHQGDPPTLLPSACFWGSGPPSKLSICKLLPQALLMGGTQRKRVASARSLEASRQIAEAKAGSIKVQLYCSVLRLGDWKVPLFCPSPHVLLLSHHF